MCLLKKSLLLSLVFFSFSLHAAAQHASGTIRGSVVESKSGSALPGINVGLENTTLGSATDAQGNFTISNVPAGIYTLVASGIGYKTYRQQVTVESGPALNISVELNTDVLGLDEVVVSATRSVESIDEVPSSVTVLDSKEISRQTAINHNLNDLLAQSVPGFGQSTESGSNWGQNLRGRDMLVMIDGIPQSTPLRNVSRDLFSIDPGVIERIEVIKGATAIYGNGATGGLINFITTTPDVNGFQSTSSIGSNISLAAPDGSMGYRFAQKLAGKNGRLSYFLSGSYEQIGLYKDAEGDIIPTNPHGQGGLSQASVYNLFGKVVYDIAPKHQVEAMYNFYSNDQETDYLMVSGSYPEQKATVQKGEPQGQPQGTRANHNLRLKYTWLDIAGRTALDASLYHQSYETVFGYDPVYYENGGQSYLDAEKYGLRLNLESPFTAGETVQGSVVYGLDLLNNRTAQPLLDGRFFVPEMSMFNLAPYVQLKTIFNDYWVVKGGLRYEDINIDVSDYTTVSTYNYSTEEYEDGVDIEGGTLNYSALTFNAGVSYKKFDIFNPFASVSQGFSIADLGRTLRSATEPSTVQNIDPEPVIVQNYELGFNSSRSWFRGSVAGFASTSDLGSSYQNVDGNFVVVRAPEMVYGMEFSLDVRPVPKLGLGGSYTLTEGRSDNNDNGSFTDPEDEFLVHSRISPPKFTAYAEYRFTSKWNTRLSILYSGQRQRFEPLPGGGFAPYKNDINSYAVFDLYSSYQLPFGSLSLGVENLFNTDYFPAISQWAGSSFGGFGYAKAPGTRVNATLTVRL